LGGFTSLNRKELEKTFEEKVPYVIDYRNGFR